MEKTLTIDNIRKIISEWGETTARELNLDCSPCVSSIGEGKNSIVALAEHFNHKGVTVVVYQDEIELDEYDVEYEDLDDDVLSEILTIMDNYDADMYKTYKRIQL